jgi:hypothetical protein
MNHLFAYEYETGALEGVSSVLFEQEATQSRTIRLGKIDQLASYDGHRGSTSLRADISILGLWLDCLLNVDSFLLLSLYILDT